MLDSFFIMLASLLFVIGMSWYGNAGSSLKDPTILQDATPASIVNSVAQTTLASFTIPANSIGPTGSLEFFVWTRWINASALNANCPIIKINLGGVQIGGINAVIGTPAPNANAFGYYCHIFLKNLNVGNAQSVLCWNCVTDPTIQFTSKFPDQIDAGSYRPVAIDTTIDNLLTVTAQNPIADPLYTTFYDGLQVKGT